MQLISAQKVKKCIFVTFLYLAASLQRYHDPGGEARKRNFLTCKEEVQIRRKGAVQMKYSSLIVIHHRLLSLSSLMILSLSTC